MLTPSTIQALADPIEEIFEHIVDELLVNIGKHITAPTWTHTAAWEIQKLSELGNLTQENAAIINKWIKQIPPAVRDTMTDTRRAALDIIEKQMERAAEAGYVTPPAKDSTVDVIREMSEQALDRYNLVNTNMLNSSVEMYSQAVLDTAQLIREAEATQAALNEAATSVAVGTETLTQAVRRTIQKISDQGLTGFVDRAGRSWTPEAYVNMVTRTTVHNTAIQSTRAFMQDYNTQVFQVSSHAGARPLCYPYQGKFYSWNNTAGEIELGNGRTVMYEPLNSTSYGEPAGLFGINCGHYPIPIVPGVTIPHGADNIQPPEENDKAYAESQEQRSLERKIREAKRVVEMAGDLATPEMKQKVRGLQADMRKFINETGRTRRYDREGIGGAPQTDEERRVRWDQQFERKYGAVKATDPLRNFSGARGIAEKLSTYSLNADHPSGKNKAVVFEQALGYNSVNASDLEAEIRRNLPQYKATNHRATKHGEMFDVIMLVRGANGNIQPVLTAWIYDPGETTPRMVTAYVHGKLHRP